MTFLEKLDFMMKKYELNKRTLSIKSDIPYTTIDNWYKRGYDGIKLETLRKLSSYFNTFIDFWVLEDVTDPNYGKANSFNLEFEETQHIIKYRSLDAIGKEAVDAILDIEHRRCKTEEDAYAVLQKQREQVKMPDTAAQLAELRKQNANLLSRMEALEKEEDEIEVRRTQTAQALSHSQ